MKTRREFLRDCSLVVGAVTLAPASTLAGPAQATVSSGEIPGFDQFLQQLNTTFTLDHAGQSLGLTLVEAARSAAYPALSSVSANENFSLMFHGPANQPLLQNTYELVHPRLGPLAIFIAPIGRPQETHCRYEAVFSRPTSATDFAVQLVGAPKRTQNRPA